MQFRKKVAEGPLDAEPAALYASTHHGAFDGAAGVGAYRGDDLCNSRRAVSGRDFGSPAEILGRTQGSFLWFLFYGVFVIAVAIHGAIGIRVIAFEWAGLKGAVLEVFMWVVGIGLFLLGARAVWAVTFA